MHYLYAMDSFKDYVEKEIIPRYASFDAAHREDKNLSRWFSREEIELAAQAAEDHRASGKNPPRINKRRTTSTSTI